MLLALLGHEPREAKTLGNVGSVAVALVSPPHSEGSPAFGSRHHSGAGVLFLEPVMLPGLLASVTT